MNILFIAPYVPSRIRVRPFHLIKELSKRHRVQVIALGEPGGVKADGADELCGMTTGLRIVPHSSLRGYCQALAALPTGIPMCAAFCRSLAARNTISETLDGGAYDVVHIEHLRAAHFSRHIRGLPLIFDSVDCLTGLFSQMAKSKRNPVSRLVMLEEAWKLQRYEPASLRCFDRAIITSELERKAFLALDPGLNIDVIPNGVDTTYFAPQDTPKAPRRIIFSGKMSYAPNAQAALWFAREVFPALRNMWPGAEFIVAGSSPPPPIEKLAEEPGITVTGYIDDLRPYLDSSVAAIAPMRVAVGIQNKILEAMAMGIPVVASPMAIRPIGDCGPGLICAETADEYIDSLSNLFDDPDRAGQAGKRAREEVTRRFSWESSAAKLERIYEEMVSCHSGRGE